jgi:hypothetical protein
MTKKKKFRGRLQIAGDIFEVFQAKLGKREQRKKLEPLFLEMQEFETRLAKSFERARKQALKAEVADGN